MWTVVMRVTERIKMKFCGQAGSGWQTRRNDEGDQTAFQQGDFDEVELIYQKERKEQTWGGEMTM